MSDLLYVCFLAWHDVPVACSHSEIEVHATFFCQLIWLGVLIISSSRVFLLHDYCGQGQIYCWTTLCSSKLFYSLTPWAKIFFSARGLLTNAAWLHYGLTSIGGFWYLLDRPLGFHIARTCTSVFLSHFVYHAWAQGAVFWTSRGVLWWMMILTRHWYSFRGGLHCAVSGMEGRAHLACRAQMCGRQGTTIKPLEAVRMGWCRDPWRSSQHASSIVWLSLIEDAKHDPRQPGVFF